MNDVLIIDYEINNISSIRNAIYKLGYSPLVSRKIEDIDRVEKIILPGVGSFGSAVNYLKKNGWLNAISKALKNKNVHFLGICLGMQLLGSKSEEGGGAGLNLIKGKIKKINLEDNTLKLPHVGWNEVIQVKESKLLKNIPDKKDFYFVHSYYFDPEDKNVLVGKTCYGKEFTTVIHQDNICGVQFHPEKSSKFGLALLKNFMNF